MTKKNRIVFIMGICLTSVAAVALIHKDAGQGKQDETALVEENTVTVMTEKVQKDDFSFYIKVNGNIEAKNTVLAYPEMSGKIFRTFATLGSKVEKGEIIAEIDPSRPGEEFVHSYVRAPISGSVISVPVKTGFTVTTETAVATIGDVSNLLISANIPERYAASLKTGIKAKATFQAYPEISFDAKVISVSPVVDSLSRTVQTVLAFDNDDSRIKAGMFAKVKFYILEYKDALTIPQEAVLTGDDGNYVYKADANGRVSRTQITTGESLEGRTRIISGLSENDTIVTAGTAILTDGAKIREIEN